MLARFPLSFISRIAVVTSLLCGLLLGATSASAYSGKACETLFRVRLDDTQLSPVVSNIQLISKYAANINRVRKAIEEISVRPLATHDARVEAARTLSDLIRSESSNDQPTFWRLFHITLMDDRIPYSSEFYETLLESLFDASEYLVHIETQKATQYAFFQLLIDQAFVHLQTRESILFSASAAETSDSSPVTYYSQQLWLRAYGTARAETTLRGFWKEKASRFSNSTEAENGGRNLAEHIRMHSRDARIYARFYSITLNQFTVTFPEAFFHGLLDQSFALAFPKLDGRTQHRLERAISRASTRHEIFLEVPRDRRLPQRAFEELSRTSSDVLSTKKRVLRELLQRKTRTEAETRKFDALSDTVKKLAADDASVFAELFVIAVRENRLNDTALADFVQQSFTNALNYVFSDTEHAAIRGALKEKKRFNQTYALRIWGTLNYSYGAEAELRTYLAEDARQKALFPNSPQGSYRYGVAIHRAVESLVSKNRFINDRAYARLLYIVFTETHFPNGFDFYEGFLQKSYQNKFRKLIPEMQDLIRVGLSFAARNRHLGVVEIDGIPRLARVRKSGDADFIANLNERLRKKFRSPEVAFKEGEAVAKSLRIDTNPNSPFTTEEASKLTEILTETQASDVAFYRGLVGRKFRLRLAGMNPTDRELLQRALRRVGLYSRVN